MDIRNETPADTETIRQITQEAFAGTKHGSGTECAIIDALRSAGTLSLSLVAVENGEVIGHVAFSPVTINGGDPGWFGLGPVSVRPGRQGQRVGYELIRNGLARLRGLGASGCVVLGNPNYYGRFGFSPDPDLRFEGVPPEYFMRLSFCETVPVGSVAYQPAFYE